MFRDCGKSVERKMPKLKAVLAFADGSVYEGRGFGAPGHASGELAFDTSMTGYEETLTDPSFIGHILLMTYPLIGNYGVSDPGKHPERFESERIQPSGFVVREASTVTSHRDAVMTIHRYLEKNGVPGMEQVDTRDMTIRMRTQGVMNAAMEVGAGPIDPDELVREARERPDLSEFDLIQLASTKEPRFLRAPDAKQVPRMQDLQAGKRCIIVDCGMKRSIARNIAQRGFDVVVVPYDCSPDVIASYEPSFVVVSNGPGDPARAIKPQESVRRLAPDLPLLCICLGHQIAALGLGAKAYKLKFGHRGGNHPVKDLQRKKVYITTQNHGFAVDPDSLAGTGLRITMKNLNDGSIEGLDHQDYRLMATQFHPEATPGPLDAMFLFDEFINSLR